MCNTWYLSMPVGTIFAFRVNARATLAHLHDGGLEELLKLEEEEGIGKLMVGYVRDVSPNGLDIGLLVSNGHAYDENASFDPTNPVIRKGLAVQTSVESVTDPATGRPRSHTLPTTKKSEKASNLTNLFGSAATRSPFASTSALSLNIQHQNQSNGGLLAALATNAPPLRPTTTLPASWGTRAYAYRPNMEFGFSTRSNISSGSSSASSERRLSGQGDTGALRVPLGARHRLVVGGYSAQGLAARPQTRFSRGEVARAERVMDGLRAEEEEERKEKEEEMARYGFGMWDCHADDISLSSGSSDGESNPEEPTSDSDGSFSSVDIGDEDSQTNNTKINGTTNTKPTPSLPIVIDIMLDLESVKSLPASPEDFERTVERLERMERGVRRRIADSIDEWATMLNTEGNTWKTIEVDA